MAYINVAEWSASHVGDWLRGLDDSILPYTLFFVNNQINGCRLLLLSPDDLIKLNVKKIGHQEIILEGVELLKQLHYNFTSETLQTVILRLACKSRSLFNQLKQHAISVQNNDFSANSSTTSSSHPSSTHEVGDHSEDSGHNHHNNHHNDHHQNTSKKSSKKGKHQKEKEANAKQNESEQRALLEQKKRIELSRVSTATLFSVGDILSAVKDFICWIDRAPFDGQDTYVDARRQILEISIQLASTAQRDRFVQSDEANEVIMDCCKKLADLADGLVQQLNDSLAFQCAQLEVVTVSKSVQEELGMFIHSSYSGVHVVSGLKYNSPAQRNAQLEEGDEIVQVNYRTVVGWQLKKLVGSMRQFPTKIILTVKKRPRHSNSGSASLISPFSLPVPDVLSQSASNNQNRSQFFNVNHIHHLHQQQPPPSLHQLPLSGGDSHQFDSVSMEIYRTLPNPVIPVLSAHDEQSAAHHLNNVENIYNPVMYGQNSHSVSFTPSHQQQPAQFYSQPGAGQSHENAQQQNSEHSKYRSNQIYGINCDSLAPKDTTTASTTVSKKTTKKNARNVLTKKRKSRIATTRCSSASEADFDDEDDLHDDTESDFSFSSDHDTANFSCSDEETHSEERSRIPGRVVGSQSSPNKKLQAQYSGPGSTSSGTSSAIDPTCVSDHGSIKHSCYDSVDNEVDSSKAEDDLDDSDSAFYSIGNTKNCSKQASPQAQTVKAPEVKAKPKISDSIKPRTSADFEALYLQKGTTPPNLSPTQTEAPCETVSHDSSVVPAPTLTSVQLSTISHLTSLAANIRFAANTPTSIATNSPIVNSPNVASTLGFPCPTSVNRSHHNTSHFDEPLANRIRASLERLTNGDIEIGDHQDFLYIYKGRDQTQNKDKTGERLPSLGPMVYDPKMDNKWTKIHATLRENCLFTNQVSTDVNDPTTKSKDGEYQFEIPVHLPGYYILVNKTDILSTNDKKITGHGNQGGNPNTVLLYVFKLVTYHHLYLFGVESTAKLAKWICKFGYRYCCNPSDSHLCFTYYLSSTHVEPKNMISNRLSIDESAKSPSKDSLSLSPKEENETKEDSISQYSMGNTTVNTESELSSDDYLDLSLNASRSRVKFDTNLNGIQETGDGDDYGAVANELSDARKFAKSPHPRGSARFSTKASNDCVEFVESKLADEVSAEKLSSAVQRKIPPQLPPRSSSTTITPSPSTYDSVEATSAPQVTESVENTPSATTAADSAPRPRPRISKMNNSGTGTLERDSDTSRQSTPTKPILPPKGPFLERNQKNVSSGGGVSAPSSVHRSQLPPISVPEKSAAISQTIQHFANLQRQNVLRRSNQQLMRAAEKNAAAAANVTQNSPSQQPAPMKQPQSSPVDVECSSQVAENIPKSSSPDYDYILSKSPPKHESTPVKETKKPQTHSSPPIGNPLYHSIASIQTPFRPDTLPMTTSSSGSSDSSPSSPPPPTSSPPAPPVVRDCVLKPNSCELIDRFDKALTLTDDFDQDVQPASVKKSEDSFQVFNMNGKILHSPKISPRRLKPAKLEEYSPKELPPILPRRANIPKKTPPPIPTTAHPIKLKQQHQPSIFTFDTPPEVPRAEASLSGVGSPDMPSLLPPNKPLLSAKSLNRSFSDAYAKSPTGRVRPRKSLESGLPLNALIDDEDQASAGGVLSPYNHQQYMPMSPAHLVAGSSTSDLNNSNRSLPTMGVSMLGKKRLSNVSADCYAIKEALNLFESSNGGTHVEVNNSWNNNNNSHSLSTSRSTNFH